MDNMYDILAKINLLEGKGAKPDFLDLDKDGNKSEPMKQASKQAKEVAEGSTGDYSAKKARAGKDIGKPGKQFSKIAADAAKRYGSKERGEKVAGAVLAKLRAKESIGEGDDIQSPRHPQELDYQQGPEDDEQYRRHHGIDDPLRRRERRLRATDYGTLDRLERQALDRAKQMDEDDLEEVSRGEYIRQQDAKAERTGEEKFTAFGQEFDTDEIKEAVEELVSGVDRHTETLKKFRTESAESVIKYDREYDEFHVITTLSESGKEWTSYASSIDHAVALAKQNLSEARSRALAISPLDDPLTRFRKKHAPSVIGDPESRSELSKLDTEYGERKKTAYGRGEDEDEDEDEGTKKAKPAGEKRGRGRPKGTTRRIGAKGPTGRSKLLKKGAIGEDYDQDEYDEEGEMAKTDARTIEDAAEELQSILDDQENLPEWVQKKISLAKDYVDRARDYMAANRPEDDEMDIEVDDEAMVAEKAVSKAQRKAAGIAYAAKKGDIPKSELRGASKEMAKMAGGELKKFAKTKEKDLPAKKTEEVEETTTAGNVAPAAEAPKGGKKGGMQFGKGVYESRLEESFQSKFAALNEDMNISINAGTDGPNSLTVSATDEDAQKLGELLKLAGMFSSSGYERIDQHDTCSECGGAGIHEAGCSQGKMVEEELANSPNPEYAELGDTGDYGVSGGLNGPKLQSNPNNPGDNPMAMRKLGVKASPNLNLGAMAEQVELETHQKLLDLYRRIA